MIARSQQVSLAFAKNRWRRRVEKKNPPDVLYIPVPGILEEEARVPHLDLLEDHLITSGRHLRASHVLKKTETTTTTTAAIIILVVVAVIILISPPPVRNLARLASSSARSATAQQRQRRRHDHYSPERNDAEERGGGGGRRHRRLTSAPARLIAARRLWSQRRRSSSGRNASRACYHLARSIRTTDRCVYFIYIMYISSSTWLWCFVHAAYNILLLRNVYYSIPNTHVVCIEIQQLQVRRLSFELLYVKINQLSPCTRHQKITYYYQTLARGRDIYILYIYVSIYPVEIGQHS